MTQFKTKAEKALANKGTKGPVHPSMSFADLVSTANRNALKPFIVECMGEIESMLRRDFSRHLIEALGSIQTRLMVLEKIAMENGETEDTLALRILDVEDEATGYAVSTDPAAEGDFLRITAQIKVEKQEKFSNPMKLTINRLAQKRLNEETGELAYQTYEDLEKKLVGARSGDEVEADVTVKNGDVEVKYTFKVKVDRVSYNVKDREAKALAAAKAAETPTEAVANG